MIKIEKTEVVGWGPAIRGMRNPMNSWDRSDSVFEGGSCNIGPNDYDLMMRLAKAGSVHAKYRRMIVVYADITAPLYWWKEFDTYKVGTVANSCSTMHKIQAKEFTMDDFSHEHLMCECENAESRDTESISDWDSYGCLLQTIKTLNHYRAAYLVHKNKNMWWQMIQLLPSSYNQKRTVMLNYEVLANIYPDRKNHKLTEWHEFCQWVEKLPYSSLITEGGAIWNG